MKNIVIISSSVRQGRLSHRVTLLLKRYLEDKSIANCQILDLKEYNFPIFSERLMFQTNPKEELLDFVEKFNSADGVIIVTPVYNQSYPSSLKNVIDVLNKEWDKKIVGLVSASITNNQGISTLFQLENILQKLGAIVTPIKFYATDIENEYSTSGYTENKEEIEKQINHMITEFIWLIRKIKG